MKSATVPSFGFVLGAVVLLSSALLIAWRTTRRCTSNFAATPAIVPIPGY
jgi:hypothetical protein